MTKISSRVGKQTTKESCLLPKLLYLVVLGRINDIVEKVSFLYDHQRRDGADPDEAVVDRYATMAREEMKIRLLLGILEDGDLTTQAATDEVRNTLNKLAQSSPWFIAIYKRFYDLERKLATPVVEVVSPVPAEAEIRA